MSRLAMALIAYSVLGVLAFATLSDLRIRSLTLLILATVRVQELGAAQRCAASGWRRRESEMSFG